MKVAKTTPDLPPEMLPPDKRVTHWWASRYAPGESTQGKGERLSFGGGEITAKEWPIADLSVQAFRERWGSGTYRIGWVSRVGSKREGFGRSPDFTITPKGGERAAEEAAARESEPARAPATDPLAMFAAMRGMAHDEAARIDQRVNTQLSGLAQLASIIAGREQAAQSVALAAQNAALAELLTKMNARLDALESSSVATGEGDEEDDEYEDDDEEEDDDGEPIEPEKDILETITDLVNKYGPLVEQVLTKAPPVQNGAAPVAKPLEQAAGAAATGATQ